MRNVRLVSGVWTVAGCFLLRVLGGGHVSPREVAFGLCMMTVSLPVLSLLCISLLSFNL